MDAFVSRLEQAGSEVATAAFDFSHAFLGAIDTPLVGYHQLEALDITDDLHRVAPSGDVAGALGEQSGNAFLYYGATVASRFIPKAGKFAPIVAGAVLGFLDPTKDGTLKGHLINAVRGATTTLIMDRAPEYLQRQGFRGDLVGNLSNVALSGAFAGVADVNMRSLLTSGSFVSLSTSSEAAVSWALMGSAFHLGSLKLGKAFQSCSAGKSTDVLLLGSPHTREHFELREYLNSLSPFGVEYRMIDTSRG